MPTSQTLDLTKGIFRRVYSGWKLDRRFNNLSPEAALLYLHLHFGCDDFGNVVGDPYLVQSECAPLRRAWTDDRMEALLDELIQAKLIQPYEVDGNAFVHISGFLNDQPANRNGRRIRRYPASPHEQAEQSSLENPGASGGFRGNPGETQRPENENESENQSHPHPQNQSEVQTQTHPQSCNGDHPDSGDDAQTKSEPGNHPEAMGELGGGFFSVHRGGVGGLGEGAGRFQRSEDTDAERQAAVQGLLANAGICGDVQRELFSRRDITPEVVERELADVRRSKNIDDPAAVLVHRLRSKNFDTGTATPRKFPQVRMKKPLI